MKLVVDAVQTIVAVADVLRLIETGKQIHRKIQMELVTAETKGQGPITMLPRN